MNFDRQTYLRKGRSLLVGFLLGSSFLFGGCHAGLASSLGKEYQGFELIVRIFFKPLPSEMPGGCDDTPEMIQLGRKLFFERDISLTRSQSCNDCHRLDGGRAGVDYLPTSEGAMGISGKRNASTVLNAGFQAAQFWDGRAENLIEQAKAPLLHPAEMAMRTEKDVVLRLNRHEEYGLAFERAFPDQAEPITFENVARSLAAFERTLITPSRFDRYLLGDAEALSVGEHLGLKRFVETGCSDCHSSYPVGGRLMRKLGIFHPYENQADLGRYTVTGMEEDRLVFKVCMLRNVTLTPPYFHDGRVPTLPEAVRLMARMQLDTVLSPKEIEEIISFLKSLEAEHPIRLE